MSADRRPLWRPFSDSLFDVPVKEEGHRLLPAERAPFQEPSALAEAERQRSATGSGRRRLSPGGATFSGSDSQL
ncbi:hypothetical protein [Kitasatospora sp. NPDC050543]|uniref:hypothetical protein n=1 Tax=Kitasatospora sp. NPDC050543 TaxID=3364054 RepID=UPI003789EC21